jgi:hypothetical protein
MILWEQPETLRSIERECPLRVGTRPLTNGQLPAKSGRWWNVMLMLHGSAGLGAAQTPFPSRIN